MYVLAPAQRSAMRRWHGPRFHAIPLAMSSPVPTAATRPGFSRYQWFVVLLLGFLQFTVILDFMILAPLGAILIQKLGMGPKEFGRVVSVYAFAACVSGILAAGFADKFDRKKLLVFFYAGFLGGTFLCGLAPTYRFLLAARLITGIFGGVIGSICFAIVTDLFPPQQRGRVMGVVQTAFSASQVLGIPIGLFLANHFNWHAPFYAIVIVGVSVGVVMVLRLRPIDEHIHANKDRHPIKHLVSTATRPRYLAGFASTILLATGGFMIAPFASAFAVNNLRVPVEHLPGLYMATGLSAIVAGPLLGWLSDRVGKLPVFFVGTVTSMAVVVHYTRLGPTPLWLVLALNMALFAAISARIVASTALVSQIPEMRDRGAYMAISASLQQLSGGTASMLAGAIVVQTASGELLHYADLGVYVAATMVVTMILMWNVNRVVKAGAPTPAAPAVPPAPAR
jgi:predicted MFS family arabinose efflux permease